MNKILYTKTEPRNFSDIIKILDPLVEEWFFSKFKNFSESQLHGVLSIHERKNILISASTGSGKTLTSFLSIINYLVCLSKKNELEEKIYCVYSSPLKALNNDILVNLLNPLEEIKEISKKRGIKLQEIRIGLRTGDTSNNEKNKMLKKPPHIFITTPESLAISLTTKKFSKLFYGVEFIIIDEIHSLDNKRGVYLSISLERLENISNITPVRVGLSATISPLDQIANFLVGENRDCLIADIKSDKKIDSRVLKSINISINSNFYDNYNSMYELINKLIQENKTSLIFTNTRSATERVINCLKEMFPENYIENIGAHHSSLSKEHRFEIEEGLRNGKLKVVVSSTSLELGIDIGYIDMVILLSSPKSSARAIQRIGRSGHKLQDISKGRFIVLDRDDLIECSILNKECIERKIDSVNIPKNCLDVLSQQIYGMCIQKIWNIDEMFKLIRRSYCYANLEKEDFMSVISYLSGEYALEHKNVYAKIWYNKEEKTIGKKGKLARVIYMTNIGTIPEESFVSVIIGSGEKKGFKVGMIDEPFLEKIKPGDIFVLGGKKYQFLFTRGMKAYVKEGIKKDPTIPSWFSEQMPLSFDSALEINKFRKMINDRLEKNENRIEIINFIKEYFYSDLDIANEIYNYFYEQYKFSKIPHEKKIVIEYYKGEKNYVIFHSLYGRRVNDALSRSIGYLMGQKTGRDIEIGINDNGFYFSGEKLPINEAIKFLSSDNLKEILEEAISKTEVLKRRFRHCAIRSLMILKNYKGKTKTVGKQQMNSFFLMSTINKISRDFPILKEARREVLEDLMDINNAKLVLKLIKDNKIELESIHLKLPSPFALNLIMQGYSDLMKIEDKFKFLKRMHEEIIKEIEDK
ncbi:MAG: ATP-dependent helicase, partial [Nanoarchaeota archaeon]